MPLLHSTGAHKPLTRCHARVLITVGSLPEWTIERVSNPDRTTTLMNSTTSTMKHFIHLLSIGTLLPLWSSNLALHAQEQAGDDLGEIHEPVQGEALFEQHAGIAKPTPVITLERVVDAASLPTHDGRMYDIEFLGKVNKPLTEVDSIKRILNALTEEMRPSGPAGEQPEAAPKAQNPSIGFSFDSNTHYNGTPMDNSVAINDNDVIVSVNNGGFFVHNFTGTQLAAFSWYGFTGYDCYDPRVIYDAVAKRFIVVALSGNQSSTSRMIMLFSNSMNPLSTWNQYSVRATNITSSIGTGTWMDFPAMGLSEREVFITMNIFSNSNTFQKSIIFQYPHATGYSGGTFTAGSIWSVSNSPFHGYHVTPAPNGWSGRFSKGQYFVVSKSSGDYRYRLLYITNHLNSSPAAQMNQWTVNGTSYSLPSDAFQPGTSKRLDVGSCAVQNAFILNGVIHFTLITKNSSNVSKVRYVRMTTGTSPSTQNYTFNSNAENYLAYPSVVPYSNNALNGPDKNVIIGMLSSNATSHHPSIRVVNCDDGGSWSNSVIVRSGQNFVSYTSNSVQRWGDYIGMCRDHATGAQPRVWIAGSYGTVDNRYRTRIAQIGAQGPLTSIDEPEPATPLSEASLYPNPAMDRVTFEFIYAHDARLRIAIMDAQGRMVKEVFAGSPRHGRNRISFSVDDLSPGLYVVTATGEHAILASQRMIVN